MSNKSVNNPELVFMEKEYDPYYCKIVNQNITINNLLAYYRQRNKHIKLLKSNFYWMANY